MALFTLRSIRTENVAEVREVTAARIAEGLKQGANVADMQQALNDSHTGRSEGTGSMLRALVGGSARQGSEG